MAEGHLDIEDARDLILGLFKDYMEDNVLQITLADDYPSVYYENLESGELPPKDEPWFRLTVRHLEGDQSTLGGVGARRFSKTGLVTVQVFVPAGARGQTLADKLGKMTVDAFEGKEAGGVWFRRVKLNEIGPEGPWFQTNVTAEFTYEQTK